jgi:tetratricopeptide (TPR) repeat protein
MGRGCLTVARWHSQAQLGRLEEGAAWFTLAVDRWRHEADFEHQVLALEALGSVHLHAGRLDDALFCLQEAQKLATEAGFRLFQDRLAFRIQQAWDARTAHEHLQQQARAAPLASPPPDVPHEDQPGLRNHDRHTTGVQPYPGELELTPVDTGASGAPRPEPPPLRSGSVTSPASRNVRTTPQPHPLADIPELATGTATSSTRVCALM